MAGIEGTARLRPALALVAVLLVLTGVVAGAGDPGLRPTSESTAILAAVASAEATPVTTPVATLGATPAPSHAASSSATVSHPVGRRAADDAAGPPVPESLTGYTWPLAGSRFTQAFGPNDTGTLTVGGQPFHDGIDLASWCGAPVRAAHDGAVLAAGRDYAAWIGWRGDLAAYRERIERLRLRRQLPVVIVIDDGNGYRSMYVHLWRVRVAAGDTVVAGQVIGSEGATGGATGCHLHYTLFSPDERTSFVLDPETAARRLLPATIVARVDPLRVLPSFATGGIRSLPGEEEPEPLILRLEPAGSGDR